MAILANLILRKKTRSPILNASSNILRLTLLQTRAILEELSSLVHVVLLLTNLFRIWLLQETNRQITCGNCSIRIIKDHHQPRPSTIVQHFNFNTRTQKPGGSLSEYVAQLRKLSEFCDFGETLDDIQCKLLAEKDVDIY